MPFENNSFDGVSSGLVSYVFKNPTKYFSEVYRVLRPGGVFVLYTTTPKFDYPGIVLKLTRTEFERKGILPRYQKEFDECVMTSLTNSKTVKRNSLSGNALTSLLKKIGFKIKSVKYAYFGGVVLVFATK